MHFEAHAGVGWALGVLAPGSDRKLRACCFTAAVIPDVDAAAIVGGLEAYHHYHHTFGHNVFFGLLVVGVGVWLHRGRSWRVRAGVAALLAACFASHLVSDAYFTRYPVFLGWPLDRTPFIFTNTIWLGSPINHALVYGSGVVAVLLAIWKRVSPLELLSPRLDRIVIGAFEGKPLTCPHCQRPCNTRCGQCEQPVCLRDGRLHGWFRIACPGCAAPASE